MNEVVDQKARDDVRDVKHGLAGHMQTTEIGLRTLDRDLKASQKTMTENMNTQFNGVKEQVAQIRSAIIWAGGLIVSILLSVMGWSVLQQVNANDAQRQELQNQIKILQESERARLLSVQNAELSASAAEAADASVSGGQPVRLGNSGPVDGGDD